jgi:hypothetical protein
MLAGAVRGAEHVVSLFVRDDRVAAVSANRTRFLDDSPLWMTCGGRGNCRTGTVTHCP